MRALISAQRASVSRRKVFGGRIQQPQGHFLKNVASFSTISSNGLLTLEALVGIHDAVLMYLMHAKPGVALEELQKSNKSEGQKLLGMSEILAKAQLHVIVPFGYNPDQNDMVRFSQDYTRILSSIDPQRDAETIKDFLDVHKSIWGVLAKRTYGLKDVKWLEPSVGRSLAMGIGANLTNPSATAKAEAISKAKDKAPEIRISEINDQVIVPAYKSAMGYMGLATTEAGVGEVYASIQVLSMSDAMVGQTMTAAMSTLISRVPLLRGEMN